METSPTSTPRRRRQTDRHPGLALRRRNVQHTPLRLREGAANPECLPADEPEPPYNATMPIRFLIHTDGASKGNPGRAGIGVALWRDNEPEPFHTLAERIPDTTNNVAEYTALLRALQTALEHGADEVEVRTDSELMARQIAGQYQVKSADLQPLYAEAKRLLARFDKGKVVHVRRELNKLADQLANQGIAANLR